MLRRLTPGQRDRVAEKLMELGNIAAGALLFGQALSGTPFNLNLALLGLLVLSWCYSTAFTIMKRR